MRINLFARAGNLVSTIKALLCAALLCVPATGLSAGLSVASSYTMNPPVLDGQIGWGEWAGGGIINFPHGFISVLNDDARLYVLLDVLGETTFDPNDYFWVSFDVDGNAAITANADLNYGLLGRNMRYQYYLGPGSWTGAQPNTFSARGEGFSASFADGSIHIQLFPLRFIFSNHRVYELAIDLAEINATPGGTARMGVRVASAANGFTDEVPAGFASDFSNLTAISLAPRPFPLPANPSAVISLQSEPLEVTQAVQTRQNTLPLVQAKTTLGRAYVNVSGVASAQPVWTYLYGSRGGDDLPGSPLARVSFVPTSINRRQLSDTPSFVLPASWPAGGVDFRVKVRSAFGAVSSSANIPLTFTPKEVPTYWVVPINTGSAGSPTLVSNAEITSQQDFLQAIYPVRRVNFVRKPWTDVGATTVANTIPALQTYWNQVALAWLLSVIFTGEQPYVLPSQIYGMTPTGGGISDPVWLGGNGYVARGFRGSSLEGTMAHEINHNLDRSSGGTWGRHTPFGCGATGPDPAWPYPNSNIQEVGFDSLVPLNPVPENFPDIMSYCQSGGTPTKWISPYRWNNLFNTFDTVSGGGVMSVESASAVLGRAQMVYYISGEVRREGGGKLNPVLVQVGLPTETIAEGRYAIELLDGNGRSLRVIPFMVSFVDVEGEPVEVVYFNYQIPAVEGTAVIVLREGNRVLHTLRVSRNAPELVLVSPNGGEIFKGNETISWEAKDQDDDRMTFNVLYSPDDGRRWYPVANNIEEHKIEIDTSALPGSEKAKFRVIATDGFNTVQDDSDAPFTLASKPPHVSILNPHNGALLPPTKPVHFEADAQDPEDGPLGGLSVYWSEGDNVLGFGTEFDASFAEGDHVVTVTAVDREGNASQDQVRFRVSLSALAHLSIQKNRNHTFRLSWPAIAGGVLQSSRNVTGPYLKTDLPIKLEGDEFVVDVDPGGPFGFFRLGPQ
jgi:hypothetical protein